MQISVQRRKSSQMQKTGVRFILFLLILLVIDFITPLPLGLVSASGRGSHPGSPDSTCAPGEGIWGLDLSHHQCRIDWDMVSRESPHFVFVKATEGVSHDDTLFYKNWQKLKDYNIIRGAYHFFSYRSKGAAQAKHFISEVQLEKGDLPPVLDLEQRNRRRMPSTSIVFHEVKEWLDIIENHYGVKPIIYTNSSYFQKYLKNRLPGDYILWIADYWREPSCDWTFWQMTERCNISGISRCVDKNVFKGTYDELKALTIQ